MSIYIITGKLGNGKTLLAVSKIREAILAGRRVATNLDLALDKMLPARYRDCSVVRLPDRPTVSDLESLGLGHDGKLDEKRYGLIVLDELAAWLNSRQWADKERQGVIDWLIHSRKRRWDIIFIIQNSNALDKQVREMLMEYHVTCKRLDKWRIPVIGRIGQILTLGWWNGCIGKVHIATVWYVGGSASMQNAVFSDYWIYRGTELYDAYDTEQVFSPFYDRGLYSYLPPWHTTGRYLGPTTWERILQWWEEFKVGGIRVKRPLPPKPPLMIALSKLPPDRAWAAARLHAARTSAR